jgi:hypothetical protein
MAKKKAPKKKGTGRWKKARRPRTRKPCEPKAPPPTTTGNEEPDPGGGGGPL